MKKNRRKKRAVTLIEIMIVILLIGLIGGALAFNMRGSMDKGRVFKSEQNAMRVYDILMMANATGDFEVKDPIDMKKVKAVVAKSPLAKDGAKLVKDAWGNDLQVKLINGDDLDVYSEKAREWENAHKIK